MEKFLSGNVITGNEKLFLQFELTKKKYGTERLFLESFNPENNNIKLEYKISDDYNEKLIKIDNPARIGVTLVNFMNKINKLLPIINKHLTLIDNFSMDKMLELYNDINTILETSNIKHFKTNNIKEILLESYQLIASNDDQELNSCKQLIEELSKENNESIYVFEIIKKIFELKKDKYNYYNNSDLIWVTADILENNATTIQQNYSFLLLHLLEKLEVKLSITVNDVLQLLIHQMFKNFYNDYRYVNNPEHLLDFLKSVNNNMKNSPYNTYYKNIYKYISGIQRESISRKNNKEYDKVDIFKKFSLQEMCKIFIQTILEDINYISNNYNNVPKTISNVTMLSKEIYRYEISSFYELFYISRYYIQEDGNNLNKCHLCGRYFSTQVKVTEDHCRRIYKENLNCCEYAIKNFRESNSIKAQISDKYNKICSMLRKRDLLHATTELEEFIKEYTKILSEINLKDISQDDKDKKILDWMNYKHINFKTSKKKQ